jgi:hypothetical protein
MTEDTHSLAALARRLERGFRHGRSPEIRLLPENQMLVVKGLVPSPAAGRRGKAESSAPGPGGYEIYVVCRPPEEHAALAATSQRPSGPASGPVLWDPGAMSLRLGEDARGGHWQVLTPAGGVLTVHARCGSPAVVAEVNRLLSEIEAVLLA